MNEKYLGLLEEVITESEVCKDCGLVKAKTATDFKGKNKKCACPDKEGCECGSTERHSKKPCCKEYWEKEGNTNFKKFNDKNKKNESISEGKKGRPKKDDSDKDTSGKEGIRDITLTATAKIDGKSHERKKKLTDINVDDIDKEKDKFEKEVNKEFDYDADVTVKVAIGKYEASDDAENHMSADDDGADGSDDSGYSIGRKEK